MTSPVTHDKAEALDHAHQWWRDLNGTGLKNHWAYDKHDPDDREAMRNAKASAIKVTPNAKKAIDKHVQPGDEFEDGEHGLHVDWEKGLIHHDDDHKHL